MRRSTLLTSLLLVTTVACSDPPTLAGTVTNVWGEKIEGATVRLEGDSEHHVSGADGAFSFEVKPGKRRVEAGKKGWIKSGTTINIDEDADSVPAVTIELHEEPARPGFYAVNHNKKEYSHLEARSIKVIGSEVGAYIGLTEDADIIMRKDHSVQFIFSSTARASELSRLGLKLNKLEFVPKEQVTGVLGDQDVAVNLWVAKDDVAYDLTGLPSEDDYLITVRGKMAPGAYAFHTEGVLTSTDINALEKTPKEMRVAYAFDVK
jgi:hypothetical protein